MLTIPHLFTRTCSALIFGSIFIGTLIFLPSIYFSTLLLVILCWILIMEWSKFLSISIWFIILTPLYPILPFVFLIYLNQHTIYHTLLYYLFSMVFAYDTCAYIAGNIWGLHRIAPTISPGKTWQGLAGGYCGTFLATYAVSYWYGSDASWTYLVLFSAIICLAAFAGDLFESWLKRKIGIKDAGTIMPGHGGLLDRFDSIMVVATIFYIFRNHLVSVLLS